MPGSPVRRTVSISVAVLEAIVLAALDALRFLTRLPIPDPRPTVPISTDPQGNTVIDQPDQAAQDSVYEPHRWIMALFPVVGLLLGAIIWSVHGALGWLLPQGPLDLLLLALLAVLSGAIHWDGLIDTADALGAPKARRLAVLKDVHAGSFGILAMVFVLACQWSALSVLSGWYHGAALLLFPVWGRWLMVAVSWNMPDMRRGGGLAGSFLARLSGAQVAAAGAVSVVISVLLLGLFGGLILLLAMGALALLLRWFYQRQFGGISGDLIGAACCLGEALALLSLSALA